MVKILPPSDSVPVPFVRQIIREVARGDVLYVAFPRLGRAMIVDLRESGTDRPAVVMARHVHDIEQQARLVEDLRPGFATIHHFSSVPWGGSTRAFAEQGVLPAILNRLPADLTHEAMAAFEQLRQMELGPTKAAGPVAESRMATSSISPFASGRSKRVAFDEMEGSARSHAPSRSRGADRKRTPPSW